jgi:hypothetical protein
MKKRNKKPKKTYREVARELSSLQAQYDALNSSYLDLETRLMTSYQTLRAEQNARKAIRIDIGRIRDELRAVMDR